MCTTRAFDVVVHCEHHAHEWFGGQGTCSDAVIGMFCRTTITPRLSVTTTVFGLLFK